MMVVVASPSDAWDESLWMVYVVEGLESERSSVRSQSVLDDLWNVERFHGAWGTYLYACSTLRYMLLIMIFPGS